MHALRRHVFVFSILALAGLLTLTLPPQLPTLAYEQSAAQVEWLEPHGVSIIDMVGEVPESMLQHAVIAYSNNGMLQYLSGQRTGDQVTINVRVTPRYAGAGAEAHSLLNCLGQRALTDSWPVVAPASTMRVFENGRDITSEAWLQRMTPAGQIYPLDNTNHFRYPEGSTDPVPLNDDGSIPVPANRGCAIVFRGYRSNLTATFTINSPRRITIRELGSETFTFHSYIGPGDPGKIGGLASQMQRAFGNRHDKFAMRPPVGAEFAFVTFPPTPVHPYVDEPVEQNLQLPGSGTYRIGRLNSLNLSVDHVVSAPIPLYWQTRDADQSSGSEFLPSFTTPGELASMEYFVPAGIPYDPCMRTGDCSNELINQIYDATMQMTIHYLVIDRIDTGLTRIPLRQVGPSWSPGLAASEISAAQATLPATAPGGRARVHMPLIYADVPVVLPPDDRTGCPCGWFDGDGRMFDFTPAPE
jgi:hypothetical protein